MDPLFKTSNDFVQVSNNLYRSGVDKVNIRDTVYGINDMHTEDTYSNSSGTVYGEWSKDVGDLTLTPDKQEPRLLCLKGKLSLNFTGSSLILRVELNTNWGSCEIYIDGQKPSTITDILNPIDIIDTNSENYTNINWAEYRDIPVCDNLPDEEHLLEIYCNNPAEQFFVISAVKTRTYNNTFPINQLWKTNLDTNLNNSFILLYNTSENIFRDIHLSLPSDFVKPDGTVFNTIIDIDDLAPTESYLLEYSINGNFKPDTVSYSPSLDITYKDPDGVIDVDTLKVLNTDDERFTYSTGWTSDNNAPEETTRKYTTDIDQTLDFIIESKSFTITVQKDYGWGEVDVIVVYDEDTEDRVGSLSSHDEDGGGFLEDISIIDLPVGFNHIRFRSKSDNPFVFTKIETIEPVGHTKRTEVLTIPTEFKNTLPSTVNGVRLENGTLKYDYPDKQYVDYNIPLDNSGIDAIVKETRFPTYCVYYSAGKQDVMETYDLIVLEPSAITRKEVDRYKSLGIKVICYISFGEEMGFISDIYDPTSQVLPNRGDGSGPCGFAPYFCKGGDRFGEWNECLHDDQKEHGIKTCSLGDGHYYAEVGRCSNRCGNDWVDGYREYIKGGVCSKGYTKENNWIRNSAEACANTNCQDYEPIHGGCPHYEKADAWAQDFSIMDQVLPDQNGIWDSYYVTNVNGHWEKRLRDYYLPTIFNDPLNIKNEERILEAHGDKFVFRTKRYPIDSGEVISIKKENGYVYKKNLDFSFDAELGSFILPNNAGETDEEEPPAVGDKVYITYTKKGLNCDGVFMDTVDTVDIYPSQNYMETFGQMINDLKKDFPDKDFCSNRGFSILNDIIGSCSYVMFESFLVDYNWETDEYGKIDDPWAIDWNQSIIEQMNELRKTNTFDVLALNYCHNDSRGDELRTYIAEECAKLGYISWSSTILLNDPLPNLDVPMSQKGPIRSTQWIKETEYKV